jgi:hypothetical protein
MSPQSRLVAGIVLIIVSTVAIGGASILSFLIADPAYAQNDLRQDLWRAGHAHAGVWLVLSPAPNRFRDSGETHLRRLRRAILDQQRDPPIVLGTGADVELRVEGTGIFSAKNSPRVRPVVRRTSSLTTWPMGMLW